VTAQRLSQAVSTTVTGNSYGDQLRKAIDPSGQMTNAQLEQLLMQDSNTSQQAAAIAGKLGFS
jgi:hypothetical protein